MTASSSPSSSPPGRDDPFGLLTGSTREDPYPVYARLRREAPVYFSQAWGGWLLTRYADVLACFRDKRFSADRARGFASRLPPALSARLEPLVRNLSSWALLVDPPTHTRLRGLLNKAFTPRLVERLRPRIEGLVGTLLDDVGARTQIEVIADLANPLPVIVIGEMLGLPLSDRHRLKAWSDALAACIGAASASLEKVEGGLGAILQMEEYFRGVIAERRARPGDDLLSALLAAEESSGILNEQELLSTCAMVLFGGHETTTNLIGNAIYLLLQHPEALDALRGPEDLFPAAVEEVLRYESPVQRMGRVLLEDVELHGERMRQGDRVYLVMGSANRDEEQFPDPDALDLGRKENRHLSLGMGTHYCVGAALGRMEAQIALRGLLRRRPRLRLLPGPPSWLDNLTIRGFHALAVDAPLP